MESEREIRLLHTKIDHMVQISTRRIYWKFKKLQTELLVSLFNQVALCQEMNQERMKEVVKM